VLVEVQVKWVPYMDLVVVVVPQCLEVVQLELLPASLALLARNGGAVVVVQQLLAVFRVGTLGSQEVLEQAVLWLFSDSTISSLILINGADHVCYNFYKVLSILTPLTKLLPC
jgi:hypothetical protein